MDQQALQAFNAEFVNLVGKQRGSTARSLVQTVQASNATHKDLPITVTLNGTEFAANEVGKAISQIKTSTSYNIEVEYSDAGRVNQVIITNATSGSGAGGAAGTET